MRFASGGASMVRVCTTAALAQRRSQLPAPFSSVFPNELQHLRHCNFRLPRRHRRQGLRAGQPDLPPELQDLCIDDKGYLIDQKTGKAVNEYGATRFDVAVRAMRGEFDPPEAAENTERSSGVILSSLMQFPARYPFQVVIRAAGQDKQQLVEGIRETIAKACGESASQGECSVKERMGGKYLSVTVTTRVRAPELIDRVYAALAKDSRVMMRF